MINQNLNDITRGLQHAAATTNSLVAEQYISILGQFFETLDDGTLKAKVVKVQISDDYYVMVPLVSMVSPSGLSLNKMTVDLSIKIEEAKGHRPKILDMIHQGRDKPEEGEENRSSFQVSISPRHRPEGKRRPADQVDISLEFEAQETPESVMRVIETYTNMIQPTQYAEGEGPAPENPRADHPESAAGVDVPVPEDAVAPTDELSDTVGADTLSAASDQNQDQNLDQDQDQETEASDAETPTNDDTAPEDEKPQ